MVPRFFIFVMTFIVTANVSANYPDQLKVTLEDFIFHNDIIVRATVLSVSENCWTVKDSNRHYKKKNLCGFNYNIKVNTFLKGKANSNLIVSSLEKFEEGQERIFFIKHRQYVGSCSNHPYLSARDKFSINSCLSRLSEHHVLGIGTFVFNNDLTYVQLSNKIELPNELYEKYFLTDDEKSHLRQSDLIQWGSFSDYTIDVVKKKINKNTTENIFTCEDFFSVDN